MSREIPIWFFVGLMLLFYGVVICGAGLYELGHPPDPVPQLNEIHPSIWWGGLMAICGAGYCFKFYPRRPAQH
jgi:hypothetical protein